MKCPLSMNYREASCTHNCALYKEGCLLAKALNIYIEVNTPVKVLKPTEREVEDYIRMIKNLRMENKKIYDLPEDGPYRNGYGNW